MATTAAILDILVRADTDKATAALRGVDSSLDKAARTARETGRQIDKSLSQTGSSFTRTGTDARRASADHDRLNKSTHRVGGALKAAGGAAVGAAAAYVGIAQAVDAVSVTEDLAKATISLNQNLGIGVKVASEYAAVASSRGVDSNKLGMAFKTLSKQIVAANDGSTSSVKLFKKLGFSQKDIAKGAKDVHFAVKGVAEGLHDMGPGAERAAAAGTLFGRGWQPLIPILRDGKKGLQEQLDLANKYGATFGGKSVKSIQDLIAAQRELKIAQMGLQIQFTEHIAPALIDAGLAVAKFIHQMETGKGAGGKFAEIMRGVGKALVVLYKGIKIVVGVVKVIIEVIGWLIRQFQKLPGPIQKFILALPVLPFYITAKAIKFVIDKLGGLRDAFGWVVRAAKNFAGGVVDGVKAGINAVIGFVNAIINILDHIPFVDIGKVSPIGGGGSKPTHAGGKKGAGKSGGGGTAVGSVGHQRGGVMVPGQGSGDKVPALLEPGEVVWNRKAVAALGGAHKANSINQAIPRFGGKALRAAVGVGPVSVPTSPGEALGAAADIAKAGAIYGTGPLGQAYLGTKAALGLGKAVAKKGVAWALNHLPMNLPSWLGDLGGGLMKGAVAYGKSKERKSAGHGGNAGALAKLWKTVNPHIGDPHLMGAIGMAESGGNPKAHGPPDGRGLWQIEWPVWGSTLGKFGNPYKSSANARMAREVLKQQGLGAWVAYTNGNYQQFMQHGGVVGMQKGGSVYDRRNHLLGLLLNRESPNRRIATKWSHLPDKLRGMDAAVRAKLVGHLQRVRPRWRVLDDNTISMPFGAGEPPLGSGATDNNPGDSLSRFASGGIVQKLAAGGVTRKQAANILQNYSRFARWSRRRGYPSGEDVESGSWQEHLTDYAKNQGVSAGRMLDLHENMLSGSDWGIKWQRGDRKQRGGVVGMQGGGVVPAVSRIIGGMQKRYPGLAVSSTTGGGHVPGSYHYQGKAVDLAGGSGLMNTASEWVKSSGLYKALLEGIHNPNLAVSGGKIFSGAGPFGAVWAGHTDHIHLASDNLGGVSSAFARGPAGKASASAAKPAKLTKADKRKARHDKLAKAIEAAKKNAAVLDIDPATNARIARLQADIAQLDEYSGYAADLGTDDAMGSYRGQSEAQLLQQELDKLFRLRDVLAAAYRVMQGTREVLQKQITQMKAHLQKLVKIPHRKRTKAQKKAINALRPQIAGAVTSLQGLTGKIGADTLDGEGVLGMLAEVQGTGGPFGIRQGGEQFGGSILQTQLALKDLGEKGGTGADSTAALDIQKTLAQDWEKRYLVSQAQYPVLQNFGGSFATGGVVPGPIGQPMMIEAHGGETVTPVGAAPVVEITIANGMEWLRPFIRAEVKKQGKRDTRGVGRTPGSAGSLRG